MKKIGIGYEFYKKFVDEDMYYMDKTLLIRDIVETGGGVTLFTIGMTVIFSEIQRYTIPGAS